MSSSAFSCLLGLAVAGTAWPQSFDARQRAAASTNPPDVHFQIEVGPSAGGFHPGERMPITLSFSSDTPDVYRLDSATYDRSGRLRLDAFVLEQTGVVDPYADYLETGVIGSISGGLRTYPVLSQDPVRITLSLNEWFRFDRPGTYRLYAVSHRIARRQAESTPAEPPAAPAVVSNIVQFRILPEDDAWVSARVSEIETTLAAHPFGPAGFDDDAARRALVELRYLSTQSAVELMFRAAPSRGGDIDPLLLVGARDRQAAIRALDEYLARPDVALRGWHVNLRAVFAYVAQFHPGPVGLPSGKLLSAAEMRALQARIQQRYADFQPLVRAEALRLIPIVEKKEGDARQVSAEVLATLVPEAAKKAGLVEPPDLGLSRAELIARLPELPERQQTRLLHEDWDLVRGRDVIPSLAAIVNAAPPADEPGDAMMMNVWGPTSIPERALRRLAQLDPEKARALVASSFAAGHTTFARFAVREMEPVPMPEAEAAFARWMRAHKTWALPVIARFASARLAPEVLAWYRSQAWRCDEQPAFLAYLARALPAEGPDGSASLLAAAMAPGRPERCAFWSLNTIGDVVWNPVVENQSKAALDDPGPEMAADAALALAKHGAPEAEPWLWKRLEAWSARWRGHTREWADAAFRQQVGPPESRLGDTLMTSLATAQAWYFDDTRRARLANLCLDERCRERWTRRTPAAPRIRVTSGGGLYPDRFEVDQYWFRTLPALESKLLQFPAGTRFNWCPDARSPFEGFSPGQQDEMFGQLRATLARNGSHLEPCARAQGGEPGK